MDSLKQYRDAGSTPDQIISCLNQELIGLKAFKEKHDIEFARYKQDCRKRALDLAHTESLKEGTEFYEDGKLLELADQYYNWLISIPNDK